MRSTRRVFTPQEGDVILAVGMVATGIRGGALSGARTAILENPLQAAC